MTDLDRDIEAVRLVLGDWPYVAEGGVNVRDALDRILARIAELEEGLRHDWACIPDKNFARSLLGDR